MEKFFPKKTLQLLNNQHPDNKNLILFFIYLIYKNLTYFILIIISTMMNTPGSYHIIF